MFSEKMMLCPPTMTRLSAGARLFAFWGPLSIFGWLSPPAAIHPPLSSCRRRSKNKNKYLPSKFISSFFVNIELSILLPPTIRYLAAQ